MTGPEIFEAEERLKDDPWIAGHWGPRKIRTEGKSGLVAIGNTDVKGRLDIGCYVFYRERLHQIVGSASVGKKNNINSQYPGSTGKVCFFLRDLTDESVLVGHVWSDDLVLPNEMETLAIESCGPLELRLRCGAKMPSMKQGMLYALHAMCSGPCGKKILGPYREENADEFTMEQIREFEEMVLDKAGWTVGPQGRWQCAEWPCESPFKLDLSEFTVPKGFKTRIVRPEFFSTVTIKNLD